jgi:glucokinase
MIIGCDIGGTKTAVVLGSTAGTITWKRQFPTEPRRGFAAMFEELCSAIEEARVRTRGSAAAISVAIGGPLDVLQGIIKSPPNLPGWDSIPLKRMLSDRFRLPVYVEHDGNAGALAEFHFGAGRGHRNIIFLTMGTGFGAGLILNGQLYRGTTDVAGEIGHVRVAEEGPPCFGKPGSLEGFCSGTGIALLGEMMFPGRWTGGTAGIYASWKGGDPQAHAVFDRASRAFGRGLAMLLDLLNPEKIILGGLGMRIADALVGPAVEVMRAEALPEAFAACQVVPAALGESIGDYAALCAAIDQAGPTDPATTSYGI